MWQKLYSKDQFSQADRLGGYKHITGEKNVRLNGIISKQNDFFSINLYDMMTCQNILNGCIILVSVYNHHF